MISNFMKHPVYMQIHTHTYIYMHIHIYIHAHAHTHTYIHILAHTYIPHSSSRYRLAHEATAGVCCCRIMCQAANRYSRGSPPGSVCCCCCSGGHVETQSTDIEVFLHGALPCLSWSTPTSLALRCPSEGCSGDGAGGHAADMS